MNNTKTHRTTQKIHRTKQKLGRVRAVLRLCGFYPGICLTTEEKAWKNVSHRKTIVLIKLGKHVAYWELVDTTKYLTL
jgi:hypothetical protein